MFAASQKNNLPYVVKEKHALEQDNTVVVEKEKFFTKLNKKFNKKRKKI